MSFLVKRKNTYHLHVKVPVDLVPMIGLSILAVSLGTRSKRQAERLQWSTAARTHQALHNLRQKDQQQMIPKNLTPSDIRRLVRDYVKADMASSDLMRATGRAGDSGTLDDELEALDADLDQSKQALATRRHVSFMGPHLSQAALGELLARQPGQTPQEQEQEHALLCYEMLKARIRLVEASIERTTGHFSGHNLETILRDLDLHELTPQAPAFPPQQAPQQESQPETKPEPQEPTATGPTLQELVDEFKRSKIESGKWRPTTVRNHQPKLNALLQVIGHSTPVSLITVDSMREYARLLELLPPSFSLKGYGDLALVSVAELAGKHTKTLDITTRREYMNIARSLLQFALDNEYLEKNPVIPGLIPPKKANQREQRLPFRPHGALINVQYSLFGSV